MKSEIKNIEIKGMKFYAHHGWFEIERKIGQYFVVDIMCEINSQNTLGDDLYNTIDYQVLYDDIKVQMQNSCRLLETVLDNIGNLFLIKYPSIQSLSIKIHKQPSLGGKVEEVCVVGSYNRPI